MQPSDQIAAGVLAKDVFEPIARDRLMIGDRGKHRDVELAQVQDFVANIRRGADRRPNRQLVD